MAVQFTIPVRKYIQHYIETLYGTPWNANKRSQEGLVLYPLLEKRQVRHKDTEYCGYEGIITVRISEDMFLRSGEIISKHNIIRFNKGMELIIRPSIRIYIAAQVDAGKLLKDSILAAQGKFGFTEEVLPFDTLKKEFFRHKQYNKSAAVDMSPKQRFVPQIGIRAQ